MDDICATKSNRKEITFYTLQQRFNLLPFYQFLFTAVVVIAFQDIYEYMYESMCERRWKMYEPVPVHFVRY